LESERTNIIQPGDLLIEATSGNTGIALAMVAAMRGYSMTLIMPENATVERQHIMKALGARLILTPQSVGMEGARDLAKQMEQAGEGKILDQFANPANPLAHYRGTGPEIWEATSGWITHFVSSMGTTGTIMGVSRYLNERNPSVRIIGVQPAEGASIPGIRKWPEAYLPAIYKAKQVHQLEEVSQPEAEETMRELARKEGIFCGVSSGGACAVALRLAQNLRDATIVFIVCDRGDRYVSSGVYGR
jgi:S-sulfo-L-cysteine synthase (O-acetyl-L-serine-dependent)